MILGLNGDEFGVIHLRFVWLEEWKSERIENSERMEKWENRKDFNFSHFCLVRSEKVSLYKFTHILLLKNDGQLKQINDKQPKKNHPIH